MPLPGSGAKRTANRQPSGTEKPELDYNEALRRLIYFLLLGCAFILIYALCSWRSGISLVVCILSVGLMTAGAAISLGGLLGFLFGVPHTRENQQPDTDSQPEQGDPKTKVDGPLTGYRPNTSLEQISDWLTKILVGVGLVEIKSIPPQLARIAAFIALGLGNNDQARVLAITLLSYFGIGGFVFGFLWARLYLPKWFREADRVEQLLKTVGRLDANDRARELCSDQIADDSDEPAMDAQSLAKAFKAASSGTREEIFLMAREAFEQRKSESAVAVEILARHTIPIVEALVANDPWEREHRYHSLLAQLWRRIPGNLDKVLREVDKAIEIRNKQPNRGWKWYEFQRARALIEMDSNFGKGERSPEQQIEKIRTDLRVAFTDVEKWQGWYNNHERVREWMRLNLDITNETTEP